MHQLNQEDLIQLFDSKLQKQKDYIEEQNKQIEQLQYKLKKYELQEQERKIEQVRREKQVVRPEKQVIVISDDEIAEITNDNGSSQYFTSVQDSSEEEDSQFNFPTKNYPKPYKYAPNQCNRCFKEYVNKGALETHLRVLHKIRKDKKKK